MQRDILARVVFVGIAVRAVHKQLRGRVRLAEQRLRRGDSLMAVVRPIPAAAHNQMPVGVAGGVNHAGLPVVVNAEKGVFGARRNHSVHRYLRVAVSAVLEPDRHTEAARHLAMGLAFGRARADSRPRNQPGEILRHDGIQELGGGIDAHFADTQQHLARAPQALADVEGVVEVGIVDHPFPPDRRARLFEIHAHHDEHAVGELVLQGFQPLRVLYSGALVVNRAWARDDHESLVVPPQDCLNLSPALQHDRLHVRGQRQFVDKPYGADKRLGAHHIHIPRR